MTDGAKYVSQKLAMNKRLRDAFITMWEAFDPARLEAHKDVVVYACWCEELAPSTEKRHWHVYLEMNRPVTVKWVLDNVIGTHGCDIQEKWSTRDATRKYIMETPGKLAPGTVATEWGVWRKQGKRTDIDAVKQAIDEGKDASEIAQDHFQTFVRYGRGLKEYRGVQIQQEGRSRERNVEVRLYWGDSGSGKTRAAVDEATEMYGPRGWFLLDHSGSGDTVWFDGYDGEHGIIFDDWSGVGASPVALMRWLDRYPCRLPVKFGHSYACWLTVWITSNHPIREWRWHDQPADDMHYKALERRIHIVKHFDMPKK